MSNPNGFPVMSFTVLIRQFLLFQIFPSTSKTHLKSPDQVRTNGSDSNSPSREILSTESQENSVKMDSADVRPEVLAPGLDPLKFADDSDVDTESESRYQKAGPFFSYMVDKRSRFSVQKI
jgi:hypothetical protein